MRNPPAAEVFNEEVSNLLKRKIKSTLSHLDDLSIAFDYEGEVTGEDAEQILEKISQHISRISELVGKMIDARKIANNITDTRTKAIAYSSQVKEPFFDEIRYHVDKLELLVDDKEWVLSKYRELLFLR